MTVVWVSPVLSEIVFATSFSFSCLPPAPDFVFFVSPFYPLADEFFLQLHFLLQNGFNLLNCRPPTPFFSIEEAFFSIEGQLNVILLNWREIQKKENQGLGKAGEEQATMISEMTGVMKHSHRALIIHCPPQIQGNTLINVKERKRGGWVFSLFFFGNEKRYFFFQPNCHAWHVWPRDSVTFFF